MAAILKILPSVLNKFYETPRVLNTLRSTFSRSSVVVVVLESEILHNKNLKSKYIDVAIDEIINDEGFQKTKESFIDGQENLKNAIEYAGGYIPANTSIWKYPEIIRQQMGVGKKRNNCFAANIVL